MTSNYTALSSGKTKILCDPVMDEDTDLETHSHIILTHLDFDALDFLENYSSEHSIYVSFEFFKLIQKLMRDNLLEPFHHNLKILPYGYTVSLGSIQVEAFPNDDGQYGSMALIAAGKKQTVGYCDAFYLRGNHKKRIKQWKRAFCQANLEVLILGSKIAPLSEQKNFLTENGMQEMLAKFISKNFNTDPLTVLLSPWDPERLYRYDKTAKDCGRPIVWDKSYLQLLRAFYPFASFYSAQNLPKDPEKMLVQVEQSKQLAGTTIFFDPAILHPNSVDVSGLIYQNQLCALTQTELKEFTADIAAKEVIMKTDRSLAQNHLIPKKWLQSSHLSL